MPADRATSEAVTPGSKDATTRRSFSSRDQRRRLSTDVITSTRGIVIGLLLGLSLGLPTFALRPQGGRHRRDTLNTTPSMIQLALSLYMVALGVGQVVFGPVSDRIGRRPVLLAGGALFAVGSLGAACSSTAEAFLCFRLVQGTGASAALVATFATVRDVYASRPENAVIYGLFSSMLAFVPAIGPVTGAV